MHDPALYRAIHAFIAGLGLPIAETVLDDTTFLPGIAIRDGGLLVDPARLRWPGDLLHEAGHLAVLPPALRAAAHDDLPGHDGDDDAHAHAGEQEAMAWAWAAAMHLGLPPEALIHEGGYRGKSRELLQMYALGIYPGLRGLCALGMTSAPGFAPPPSTAADGMRDEGMQDEGIRHDGTQQHAPQIRYPQMLRWLRD